MTQTTGAVTFKGNPMTLTGTPLTVGQPAPEFNLTASDMSAKTLADYAGKVIILSTVPSLDTPVCQVQTSRFNQEAGALGDDVVILTVSVDLPFAQKRWCGANEGNCVELLSDYKDHNFMNAYGLRVEELGLIARSVSVIDKEGNLTYHELVGEIADEPKYDAVLEAAKAAL